LYQADEGAFPYYDVTAAAGSKGIGLWSLYAFPKPGDADALAPVSGTGGTPVARYVRSAKVLHCPQDDKDGRGSLYTSTAADTLNVNYLSYQVIDADAPGPTNADKATYQSFRSTTTTDADWTRQLLHKDGTTRIYRMPADNTVVTWCRWHRPNTTSPPDPDGRPYDNVLFYDGSVHLIRQPQRDPVATATPQPILQGWHRKPRPPA
ncbi:MAG TPA: hypothetical protein VF719_09665, partial [Abditibacteriaceae bacterium]